MAILTTAVQFGGKRKTDGLRGDLVMKPAIAAPSLSSLGYDVREDVENSDPMYKIIPSNKVTRKATTCGWNPYGNLGSLVDDSITVVKLKIEMEQCAVDFDGKILQAVKKRGYDRENLTDTEFAQILEDIAVPIINNDMVRIIALGDTADASPDYNMLDGKWKKIKVGVGNGTIFKAHTMPITATITPAEAIAALNAVHFTAPIELQTQENTIKVVSRTVYNAYMQYLSQNSNLESSWSVLQNGIKTLTHFGVPVVAEDVIDKFAVADGFGNPHRIYYTAVNNVTVGTDLESDFNTIRFWYEEKEEMNLMRVNYKLGVSLGFAELFSVAY